MKRYIFGLVVVVVVALGYIVASYYSVEPIKGRVIAMAAVEGDESQARSTSERAQQAREDAQKRAEDAKKEQQVAQKTESADSDAPKQDNPKADESNVSADAEADETNVPADSDSTDETEAKDEESDGIEPPDPNAPPEVEDNDPNVPINLNNVEMKQIISKLAEWTGKVIIPTDDAMKIKITIYSSKKVPVEQALSLIYDALRMKGIIAEIGEDKIFLKPLAQAKLGQVPTLSVDEPLARMIDKSILVEKYFKVKNISPATLVDVISPLIAEYGHVTAIESTGVIAVIDTVENLMRIKKIIDQFDAPESDQIIEKVFEIENGDPIEIVQVLELILSPKSQGGKPKKPSPSSKKEGVATSVIIEAGQIPTVLLPVPRQNWIIARASVDNMQRIETWIEKLDVKEAVPPESTVIPVEFVDVREVARLARNAIEEMAGDQLKTSVVIQEMENAKQIVVFGSEENRKIVERLVAEIDLPIEDIYKTKVFRLKHADPEQIKLNIEALYEGQAGSYSSYNYRGSSRTSRYRNVNAEDVVKVVTDPILNSVSVIAAEENLRKIALQIEEWDQPIDLAKDQYRIVTLHNSDPVKMVELLSSLFSESDDGGRTNIFDIIFGRGRGGDDEKKKIVGNLYGLLTFEEVPGTKKILIISKVPEAYGVIEKLIEDLDSQEKGEIPRVVTLNYADAEELCDQLNGILNESGTTATIPRKQRGLSYSADEQAEGTTSNPNQADSDPGMITPWWDRQRQPTDEMPTSNLIGKIRFVPVHRSKAILVLSPPEYVEEIEAMIRELDKPGKQVMIEAVIVEVDHASMTSLGVKLASDPSVFGALGENAVTTLTEFTSAGSRTKSSAGVLNGILTQGISSSINVNVLIDLLAKTINAKVLNQPNLWTKDNEEAEFFKGEDFAVISGDQQNNSGGGLSRSYERTQVGVTLRIRPNITPEKDVDVTINLEISNKSAERENGQPVIKRLSTSTNLIIADGETIMLGGILFQTDSLVHTKVPLLGDVPFLGGLFRHNGTELRNSELLVFITPHVIDGSTTDAARRHIEEPKERMRSIKDELDGALVPIMD